MINGHFVAMQHIYSQSDDSNHCIYACRHGEDQNRKEGDLMSSRPVATPVSEDLETEAAVWTCSPKSDITGLEKCFLV